MAQLFLDLGDTKGAVISPCMRYRYVLWRMWGKARKLTLIGLNPSVADAKKDDPTMKKIVKLAQKLGYGGVHMLNLFAWRDKSPEAMKKAKDPIGPENDKYLLEFTQAETDVVVCWGAHGTYLDRGREVLELIGRDDLKCFGLCQNGQPKHPLFLSSDTKLEDFVL